MHEFNLHEVIYNVSQFEEKFKILLKNKNACLCSAEYTDAHVKNSNRNSCLINMV